MPLIKLSLELPKMGLKEWLQAAIRTTDEVVLKTKFKYRKLFEHLNELFFRWEVICRRD